jgi:hypothetical protein
VTICRHPAFHSLRRMYLSGYTTDRQVCPFLHANFSLPAVFLESPSVAR